MFVLRSNTLEVFQIAADTPWPQAGMPSIWPPIKAMAASWEMLDSAKWRKVEDAVVNGQPVAMAAAPAR